MDNTDLIKLTLYLVGETEVDALEHIPFDSFESAESHQLDVGGHVYSISAYIDSATIEKEDWC